MDGMSGMMFGMLIWALLGLALLALAAVAIIWLIRRPNGPNPQGSLPDAPEDILRRRFASGEIDEDEYARGRSALKDY